MVDLKEAQLLKEMKKGLVDIDPSKLTDPDMKSAAEALQLRQMKEGAREVAPEEFTDPEMINASGALKARFAAEAASQNGNGANPEAERIQKEALEELDKSKEERGAILAPEETAPTVKTTVTPEQPQTSTLPQTSFGNTWDGTGEKITKSPSEISSDDVKSFFTSMSENPNNNFQTKNDLGGPVNTTPEGEAFIIKYDDEYGPEGNKTVQKDQKILCEKTNKGVSFFNPTNLNKELSAEDKRKADASFARTVVKWSLASGQDIDTSSMDENEQEMVGSLLQMAEKHGKVDPGSIKLKDFKNPENKTQDPAFDTITNNPELEAAVLSKADPKKVAPAKEQLNKINADYKTKMDNIGPKGESPEAKGLYKTWRASVNNFNTTTGKPISKEQREQSKIALSEALKTASPEAKQSFQDQQKETIARIEARKIATAPGANKGLSSMKQADPLPGANAAKIKPPKNDAKLKRDKKASQSKHHT
jgi:hypothetical protein